MTIPNPTITQFTSTTVHSDTAHNLPHNELLANDNDLQSQISNIKAIVQLGSATWIPSPSPLTTNHTNDAVPGWTITKQLSDAQSKLVIHMDIQWYGYGRGHDQTGGSIQFFIRATGQALSPGTQGLGMYNYFAGGMGEDWADFYISTNATAIRIVRANAGSVRIGYQVVFTNSYTWATPKIDRLTMTYFELATS